MPGVRERNKQAWALHGWGRGHGAAQVTGAHGARQGTLWDTGIPSPGAPHRRPSQGWSRKPRPKRGGCQAAPASRSPPRATGGASGNPRPGRPGGRGGSGSERNYLGHGTDVRAAGAGEAAWVLLPRPRAPGRRAGCAPFPRRSSCSCGPGAEGTSAAHGPGATARGGDRNPAAHAGQHRPHMI